MKNKTVLLWAVCTAFLLAGCTTGSWSQEGSEVKNQTEWSMPPVYGDPWIGIPPRHDIR